MIFFLLYINKKFDNDKSHFFLAHASPNTFYDKGKYPKNNSDNIQKNRSYYILNRDLGYKTK